MAQTQSTPWEKITLANNFLFCKIMGSNPDLCKHLIEILLHVEIDHLEVPQTEKSMKETLDSKSVRFDVYTKDDRRIFDLEIQTTNKTNLPKRARYYQSIIDMDNLSAGMNYSQLKDTYVIFLCLGDIFRKGLPVYSFENICLEDKRTKLDDRAFKVFFNAAECDKLKGHEERAFFKFLKGESAGDDFTKRLEEKVERAKKNARWRKQYMTWQQTIDEERFEARE
ncbi:MAG: Rpn family recombination-promoting nuclease/putative transposase, partial [Treponema sp.]|nr:Rpn family recombination-promoting nuclease/putative transposase [Treponema sp.]